MLTAPLMDAFAGRPVQVALKSDDRPIRGTCVGFNDTLLVLQVVAHGTWLAGLFAFPWQNIDGLACYDEPAAPAGPAL